MTATLIYLSFLLCFCANAKKIDTLDFIWTGDSINSIYIDKTAMLIPVQIKNDSNTYYFQFDTGANISSIYTGNQHGLRLKNTTILSDKIETNIGTIEVDALSYMSPFLLKDKLVIGTIGADILVNKILQIDFLNQKIILSTSFDSSKYVLFPLKISYGRPAIILQCGNKTYDFLFDTGSSLFELWTTKKMWKNLRLSNAKVSELPIRSWGKVSSSYITVLEKQIMIYNCSNIQIKTISYNSNKNFKQTFKEAGVHGVIGNKPFLNEVIIIDISSKIFGIRKCA